MHEQRSGFHNGFISYGRADSKAFAFKLYQHLTEYGLKIWFDFENIPLGVDFQNQIDDGIEKADNFLFIIAPHSINSPYCRKEIELAIKYHKRIIPLLHVEQISRDTWQQRNPQGTDADWDAYQAKGLHSSFPNMHPTIGKINWVYCREGIDDFEQSFSGLLELLARHKDYVNQHTYFLDKSLAWERQHKGSQHLLIGKERQQAEAWLKVRFKDEQPPCTPTDLHCEFISESIKNAYNLMSQVFLSYAYENEAVMRQIRTSLWRAGFTVWTNTADIQTGETFEAAIKQGVAQADNLVYLLSPDSLNSTYCQQELNYALALNKRIIPVLVSPVEPEQIPPELRSLHYIDLTDNLLSEDYRLDESQLIKILDHEAVYYHEHKIFLAKALKWQQQNRNPSILLRGYNLRRAEAWLQVAKKRTQHQPTAWHEEFTTESLRQPPEVSHDVFISSSDADSDFVRKLNDALQMQGKTTWFEQESIATQAELPQDNVQANDSTDLQPEIYQGIERANTIIAVISPGFVKDTDVAQELAYAQRLNKRMVAILYQETATAELPLALENAQWIDFRRHGGEFLPNFGELIRSLDSDPDYVQSHTRLLVKAREWEQQERDDSFLLRGKDLVASKQWLQESADKQPKPTALQLEYLKASQELPYRKIKWRSVFLTSAVVSVLVVVARLLGGMESAELRVYDQLMRLRPSEAQDERFLIVEVDAASSEALRQDIIERRYQPGIGTIPDKALDQVLAILSAHQPRLIGLDFYRDYQAQPELAERFGQTQNLIALCKASYDDEQGNLRPGNPPPREIPMERIGFNDVSEDGELMVRRHLLLQEPDPGLCNTEVALNLVLARKYLDAEGISYTSPLNGEGYYVRDMQLGETAIPQLRGIGSPYQERDNKLRGYQTLLNYRAHQGDPNQFAPTVSLEDVLNGKVSAADIQDRIVIIGYTDLADKSADLWNTPYGNMPGVMVQAQMASQIISAVLDERPLIWWLPFWGETLWIFGWSTVGGLVIWFCSRSLARGAAGAVGTVVGLYGVCYLILVSQSGWVPLVPPAIAIVVTGGGVGYLTYRRRQA